MAWSVPATAFDSIGAGVGTTALDLATSLEGDVVLLVCFSDGNIVFDTDETFTDSGLVAGQGWIDLYFAGGANNPGRLVAYKVMGSTPDTTVDFENPSARAIGVQSIVIRGADTTTPIHAQSSLASGATGIANAPSLETTVANTLRIIFGIVDDETNVMSAPSGWTLARAEAIPSISANSNASCVTAYLESASAGTVDPDAFGGSADDEWVAGHIAFAPALSGGGIDRAALIEGASTVAANRLITRTRSAAVSAASTTAAAALLSKSRAAAIAGASTVAASALRTVTRAASIAAQSSVTAAGSVAGGAINRAALIEAQSSVTATAQRTITRAATVAAQSGVTAAGAVSGNVSRSATVEAASSVTASAVRTVTRSVAIAGVSSLAAGGTVGGVTARSALVEAASSLTAQAIVTRRRVASVTSSSGVVVDRGGVGRVRSVTVEAASAVSVVSVRTLARQATIAANSNVDVSAVLAGETDPFYSFPENSARGGILIAPSRGGILIAPSRGGTISKYRA